MAFQNISRYKQRKDRLCSERWRSKCYAWGSGRNRGEISEVVVFASVGDGFQVFCISAVGDADTCGLSLLCHGNSVRLGNKAFARQLAVGVSVTEG